VPAGLAQEELQRVGGRLLGLHRRLRRRGRLLGDRLLDHLDPARLELAVERLELQLLRLQRLEDVDQLGLANRSRRFGRLQQLDDVVVSQQMVDLDSAQA
jgi:hypothetical protein